MCIMCAWNNANRPRTTRKKIAPLRCSEEAKGPTRRTPQPTRSGAGGGIPGPRYTITDSSSHAGAAQRLWRVESTLSTLHSSDFNSSVAAALFAAAASAPRQLRQRAPWGGPAGGWGWLAGCGGALAGPRRSRSLAIRLRALGLAGPAQKALSLCGSVCLCLRAFGHRLGTPRSHGQQQQPRGGAGPQPAQELQGGARVRGRAVDVARAAGARGRAEKAAAENMGPEQEDRRDRAVPQGPKQGRGAPGHESSGIDDPRLDQGRAENQATSRKTEAALIKQRRRQRLFPAVRLPGLQH